MGSSRDFDGGSMSPRNEKRIAEGTICLVELDGWDADRVSANDASSLLSRGLSHESAEESCGVSGK